MAAVEQSDCVNPPTINNHKIWTTYFLKPIFKCLKASKNGQKPLGLDWNWVLVPSSVLFEFRPSIKFLKLQIFVFQCVLHALK